MRKLAINFALILLLFTLTSCTEVKTLEKMGMITTTGYDLDEDGKIQTTSVLLQIDPEAPKSVGIITSKSTTSKGARVTADLKSPKKLQSGQLRVALYSEQIAKQGFINLADTLARDPSISDLTYLAIVEGSVFDLLHIENDQFADIGQYIFKELDQNIKGELIPSSTLQETMHDYYSDGTDPVLPILKDEDNQVKIAGVALMKMDRMVGKISPYQAFYLKLINGRYKAGSLEILLPKNGFDYQAREGQSEKLAIVLDTINSKSKIELTDKNGPNFRLNIRLDSRLLEINQTVDLRKPKNIELLEKSISKEMKREVEDLIKFTQEKDSDPLGFGEVYRSHVRHSKLNHKKWHELYKNAKIDVSVKFNILRTGAVE